jgi:hypothetical protein
MEKVIYRVIKIVSYFVLGKLSLSSGDVYEGEFNEGKRQGSGVMYLREPMIGVVYTGEW